MQLLKDAAQYDGKIIGSKRILCNLAINQFLRKLERLRSENTTKVRSYSRTVSLKLNQIMIERNSHLDLRNRKTNKQQHQLTIGWVVEDTRSRVRAMRRQVGALVGT